MRVSLLLFALALAPLSAQLSAPSRTEIEAMERNFDQKLQRFSIDAPVEVLGLTRGIYLPGYGAAFTAEVSLVQTPGVSPFRPTLSKEDVSRVRAAKLRRLPEIRHLMQEMLLNSAGSMDRVPMNERLVLGLFLFYNSWEDVSGMPHRITMQAPRRGLLDVATNRQPKTALDTIIQVREE
ncbi:hypothetical protein [uncultured Paludibaculum sp.]|uniref:hypothetical protein n=1 Tax=uncultured Paludibaculum sp. TaxID=1765020 RepID=UPI002AABC990|nr:hypothetical protein [uncultured Paludibaculum sp.]